MLNKFAYIFGFVFIVVGVLGFVPELTNNNMLFNYFHVNLYHNIIHIVTGLFAILAASEFCTSTKTGAGFTPRFFFRLFGVIYGAIAIAGFWFDSSPIFGWVANNFADSVFHTVIAAISLYLGFGYKE